jgi:hypothetical protein
VRITPRWLLPVTSQAAADARLQLFLTHLTGDPIANILNGAAAKLLAIMLANYGVASDFHQLQALALQDITQTFCLPVSHRQEQIGHSLPFKS